MAVSARPQSGQVCRRSAQSGSCKLRVLPEIDPSHQHSKAAALRIRFPLQDQMAAGSRPDSETQYRFLHQRRELSGQSPIIRDVNRVGVTSVVLYDSALKQFDRRSFLKVAGVGTCGILALTPDARRRAQSRAGQQEAISHPHLNWGNAPLTGLENVRMT